MRLLIVAFSVALFAAQGLAAQNSAATKKKSSTTKRTSKATPNRTVSAARSTARRTASKSLKKPVAAAVSRHSTQRQPTRERYQEIQRALADRGCFSGPADGNWGSESVEALKRFQREQNLTEDGKIGSLSLIALGLGPKRVARTDLAPEKPVQQP